ncbi:hypothetical protein VP1G_11165 [Cytospora mali]|uniref:SnoaL-like domain-containing protein n=1 Tax=Cytospora mali TaxID=578113 RepID=A0A194V8F6_CYTMA|nr:hypothetical protein VP1G_11165 [Valsa mali var. pyri (nom. inval.)]
MPAPAHIQAATLDRFIAGWKKWTPEDYLATWSDDCTQQLMPFSLGVPARSRAEVNVFLPKLMTVLTNYELETSRIVHDAANSKAVIYASSKADTLLGDSKWKNDFAVFLSFTEDGEKINRMEEMVDTAFYQEFFPRFQKYLKETEGTK